MAQSIADIEITTTWQSVNTLSGIAVGTAFELINKSNRELLVWKGTTPVADSVDGIPVASFPNEYCNVIFEAGELDIWCRVNVDDSGPAKVHVQTT